MKERVITLTPSEFMIGYLVGHYGGNQLQGEDSTTQLVRSVASSQVSTFHGSIKLTQPTLRLAIDPIAREWADLIEQCEFEVRMGMDIVDIYKELIGRCFKEPLIDRRGGSKPLAMLFDFITEHLVNVDRSHRLGWDMGGLH